MEQKMLNIVEVRNLLGLSAFKVIRLVQTGKLRPYNYVGGPANRESVTLDTQGLRFRYSDIEAMLEESLVK